MGILRSLFDADERASTAADPQLAASVQRVALAGASGLFLADDAS